MQFSDFGFKENPFSITPDPRYLFLSRGHEESLAHLIYGTGPNGGFVQLTGEVGTGKTMLVRSLLAQQLEDVDIALILNPRLSRIDFMAAICDELGIAYQGSPYLLKQLSDQLTQHLLRTHTEGRHTVLVVDEAQNLSPQVLEQVRLLTNLETARHKLLRIILVGQPELKQLLAREDLRQVDQRITARYHLSPLSGNETVDYIRHRLAVAGVQGDLFSPAAMRLVYRLTGGVPRLINTLCERSLLAIFATGARQVGMRLVWRAAREIRGWRWKKTLGSWLMAGLLLMGAAVAVWNLMSALDDPEVESLAIQPSKVDAGIGIPRSEEELAQFPVQDLAQELESGSIELVKPVASSIPDAGLTESVIEEAPSAVTPSSTSMNLHQQLFALWGKRVSPQVERNPCAQARLLELRCLTGTTDWEGLARMNRPALLSLTGGEGQALLLLKQLGEKQLLIVDGEGERLVERDEIVSLWQGKFLLLWRPATEMALLGPGSSGVPVTWLREQLALAEGKPAPRVIGVDHFDEGLKQQLLSYQLINGLEADGVAGSQTMISLNQLQLVVGTPTLLAGD